MNDHIGSLSIQLSELSEKLDDANESLATKSGNGVSSEDGSNVAIIGLKQAIRRLRDETKAMTLSIGLISAQLMSEQKHFTARSSRTQSKRVKRNRKNRNSLSSSQSADEL